MIGGNGDALPEVAITRLILRRLQDEDCLRVGDRESLAYRIAELMVASKNLYTGMLPRLTREAAVEEPLSMYEELTGFRMALLHLRDLVGDFDEAFFDAMSSEREETGVGPLLPPEEYEDEPEEEEEDE